MERFKPPHLTSGTTDDPEWLAEAPPGATHLDWYAWRKQRDQANDAAALEHARRKMGNVPPAEPLPELTAVQRQILLFLLDAHPVSMSQMHLVAAMDETDLPASRGTIANHAKGLMPRYVVHRARRGYRLTEEGKRLAERLR